MTAPSTNAEIPREGDGGDGSRLWRRIQREARILIDVTAGRPEVKIEGTGGLVLAVTVKPVGPRATREGGVPPGTKSVSVFLIIRRVSQPDETRDAAFAFQAQIE